MISIAVAGVGAIGASIAHALFRNGVPFTVLARNPERLNELSASGIDFKLVDRAVHIAFHGEGPARVTAFTGTYDAIFLSMKASQLTSSIEALLPLLSERGRFVLLQNGLPEQELAPDVRARCVSGIVGYNVQLTSGVYWQSNPGHLILGAHPNPDFLPDLARAISPHEAVTITENPEGYRWNKLAINAVINGLGAVSGESLGVIFSSKAGRRAAIALLAEAGNVMRALHVKEEIVPGTISVYRFGPGGLPSFLQHAILYFLGRKYRHVRTSMLQDILAGRKTEIQEIHGAIARAANTAGVQVPVISRTIETVEAVSRGAYAPSMGLLDALGT